MPVGQSGDTGKVNRIYFACEICLKAFTVCFYPKQDSFIPLFIH